MKRADPRRSRGQSFGESQQDHVAASCGWEVEFHHYYDYCICKRNPRISLLMRNLWLSLYLCGTHILFGRDSHPNLKWLLCEGHEAIFQGSSPRTKGLNSLAMAHSCQNILHGLFIKAVAMTAMAQKQLIFVLPHGYCTFNDRRVPGMIPTWTSMPGRNFTSNLSAKFRAGRKKNLSCHSGWWVMQ